MFSTMRESPVPPRPVRVGDHVDGGTYVDIGGRPLWHFTAGSPTGAPTVLVHGVFASAASWVTQTAELTAAGLHLYIPERSGSGHTPDIDGPWTMAGMAAQLIEYLESVVEAPAHLIGWSDGATVSLLVARARPDLVSRLVLIGNYLNPDGRDAPDFFHRLVTRDPDLVEFLRGSYDRESPDGPEHFDEVYRKSCDLILHEPRFPISDFAMVATPTMVVAADRGVVLLEHSLALSRALPNGRLAVLPGTHILPIEAPELINPLVLSFLMSDPPKSWTP